MDNAHGHRHEPESLNRAAFGATWHCLTGCEIGEILGLVIATALDWGNVASIAIAIVLAFCFGYSFFFFNDTATTEIYTLSLHDALPILCHHDYDQCFQSVQLLQWN